MMDAMLVECRTVEKDDGAEFLDAYASPAPAGGNILGECGQRDEGTGGCAQR